MLRSTRPWTSSADCHPGHPQSRRRVPLPMPYRFASRAVDIPSRYSATTRLISSVRSRRSTPLGTRGGRRRMIITTASRRSLGVPARRLRDHSPGGEARRQPLIPPVPGQPAAGPLRVGRAATGSRVPHTPKPKRESRAVGGGPRESSSRQSLSMLGRDCVPGKGDHSMKRLRRMLGVSPLPSLWRPGYLSPQLGRHRPTTGRVRSFRWRSRPATWALTPVIPVMVSGCGSRYIQTTRAITQGPTAFTPARHWATRV